MVAYYDIIVPMIDLEVVNRTLFVFVDESGNLDFSPNGTAYYVLAAVATTDPLFSASELQKLKYEYLKNGDMDIEFFHASEDRQFVRDRVISTIKGLQDKIHVHYIHAQKNKTNPALQNPAAFYAKLGSVLSKFIIQYKSEGFSKVIIIFDKCLRGKEQKAFLKEVKPELKQLGKPYQIYFHRTLSDFNGQIADYFAWSKYVFLEREEKRPSTSMLNIEQTDFDLFSRGKKEYY